MPFANVVDEDILEHFTGKNNWPAITAMHLALWVGSPGKDGTGGAEVTGTGYTRQQILAADWNSPLLDSLTETNAAQTFTQAGADWSGGSTIDNMAMLDVSFIAGALTITIGGTA